VAFWHPLHIHPTRAIFGVQKIKLKSIASVASDNKDEMYIPDDPKQVEKHLRNKGAPWGAILTPPP